jgi:hypothetical protein
MCPTTYTKAPPGAEVLSSTSAPKAYQRPALAY